MEAVRLRTEAELRSLADFAAPIWHEHYDPITGAEQVDYMVEKFQSAEAMTESLSEGYRIYEIREDGKRCGYISICPHEDHMYLSKFYLHSSARGKGIGRKMMDFVESEAKKEGFNKVMLNVNKENGSIEIYKRLGYEIAYPECNDIGNGYFMDDYVMSKNI